MSAHEQNPANIPEFKKTTSKTPLSTNFSPSTTSHFHRRLTVALDERIRRSVRQLLPIRLRKLEKRESRSRLSGPDKRVGYR